MGYLPQQSATPTPQGAHHGDFFACYERSDSNTPFQADRTETDVAQEMVANALKSVHSVAAGSTTLAPSVADAADNDLTFEQTGDPLLLIGRDSGRRRQGDRAVFFDQRSFQ